MDHSHHDHSGHDHSQHAEQVVAPPSGGHEMHGHSMSFHFGSSETVLFEFWKTETAAGLLLSSLLIVLMCFVMEAARWYRSKRETMERQKSGLAVGLTPHRIVDMLLHAVQLTLAYILMLVFMTFNVWLCAVTVAGEVIIRGIFAIFLPLTDSAIDSPCH